VTISVKVFGPCSDSLFIANFTKSFVAYLYSNLKLNLLSINFVEIVDVNLSAFCVSETVKRQLEKRVPFRKVIKSFISKPLSPNLKGIKIQISGRLNGSEIARTEWIRNGRIPLHTLSANIDYSFNTALVFKNFIF
jgi:ribosomal protein S3